MNTYCNVSPVGDDLGLDVDGIHNNIAPVKRVNQDGCTEEDYLFVHTDSHKEFMELLLEKRKKLESDVTAKLKSREKSSSEGKEMWGCGVVLLWWLVMWWSHDSHMTISSYLSPTYDG